MGKSNRNMRLRVNGQRRRNPDVRKLARAIVRLAVELDSGAAQELADRLEHEEALRRTALKRARSAQRAAVESDTADNSEADDGVHR